MPGFLGQGGVSPVPGAAQGDYPQYFGIFYGTVSNNTDPQKKNRCLLRVPQLLGGATTTWAASLTPLAKPPAVGTLIVAMFIGGDLDNPCYLVVNPLVETVAGNIKPIGTTGAAGTSVKYAAADHVHGNISTLSSDMQADGTAAAGSSGRIADAQHVHPGGNYLAAGSGGFLQINSSQVTGGDTQPALIMESADYAGQSTVQIDAQNIQFAGYSYASQPTPTIFNVSGTADDGDINSNFGQIVSALQAAGVFH